MYFFKLAFAELWPFSFRSCTFQWHCSSFPNVSCKIGKSSRVFHHHAGAYLRKKWKRVLGTGAIKLSFFFLRRERLLFWEANYSVYTYTVYIGRHPSRWDLEPVLTNQCWIMINGDRPFASLPFLRDNATARMIISRHSSSSNWRAGGTISNNVCWSQRR